MARFESAMNRVRKKTHTLGRYERDEEEFRSSFEKMKKKTDVVVELSSATTLTKRES